MKNRKKMQWLWVQGLFFLGKVNFSETVLSTIQILSEHLANQIAAGEVIERPASVVKEFVENSIDAAASHISIQIEGDGTRLIRVVGDGCGMDQDDVLLCLERHATSKLFDSPSSHNQLSAVTTLGFRGGGHTQYCFRGPTFDNLSAGWC